MGKFRITTLLLSVYFLFLFGGIEFFHHHSGIHEGEICKVCSLSVTLSNTLLQAKRSLFVNDSFQTINPKSSLFSFSLLYQYPFTGRAPPFLV